MMQKIGFLVILLVLVTLAGKAQKITVLTYNIRHAQNMHGNIELDTLAAFILAQNADVVALQEVDSACHRSLRTDIMKELGRRTGMYYYFGKAMDYDGGGYGEGLLTRWPVEAIVTQPLPYQLNKNREPRAAIECILKGPNNKKIKIIATHLDHLRDSTDRIMQTQHLYALYEKEPLPFIITGDLNALPSETSIQQLLKITRQPNDDNNQPTFPAVQPERKIDYILVSKNYAWKDLHYQVLNEEIISDHRPVIASFEWPH